MTITDETRYHLHQRLETVLGPEDAATLMEHLPPVGWADVATKRDLDQFALVSKKELDLTATELRLEIARLGTELKGDIAGLRTELKGDIAGLRTELKGDIAGLRDELKGDVSGLRDELKDEIATRAVATERNLRGWVIGSQALMLTVLGLLIQLH